MQRRWGSRDVSEFEIVEQIGEGTYGWVSRQYIIPSVVFKLVCLSR